MSKEKIFQKDFQEYKEEPQKFNFDILMANPPFAGDVKDNRMISGYELASLRNPNKDEIDEYKSHSKIFYRKSPMDKMSRDILFIERNLDFIKDGGRMAIVLPQGRFNNTSDLKVRNFIMERARLIAIVGLDGNTFKPHTGTKKSVLLIQKWDEDKNSPTYNPKQEDYQIFMAVSENSGKDNSGEPIYLKNKKGENQLDQHNHLIQQHDLKEIAEEFIKWGKEEKLSFWR